MKIIPNRWFKPKDRILFPGDIHFPNHNPKALSLMLKAAKGFGCNKSGLLGDFFDSCHISRHEKTRDSSFKRENACMAKYNRDTEAAGMEPTVALWGNHEFWFNKYAEENPGHDHEELYPALYEKWDVISEPGVALELNANLVGAHGDGLNGACAAQPAASVLRNYPALNIIFAHNHRLDVARVTRPTHKGPRTTIAASIGTMASIDYELSKKALQVNAQRHSLGFGVVTLHPDDLFEITLGSIVDTKKGLVCLLAGELYK